jgi:hypothetical protein
MMAAMSLFETIQYVGTPIALVAFIIAVVAYTYRGRLEERRKLIEAAPEQERGRLLEATLRDFTTVPTDTLSREQRHDLAVRLIDERAAKFKLMTLVSIIVAFLLAAVVIVFTLVPDEAEAGSLTVRVHGPAGVSDFMTNGEVTLDVGTARSTHAIGPDGQVRFENIPDQAFANGVRVIPHVPGYHAVTDTTFDAVPAGRVVQLGLAPTPTRVYGTVVDAQRTPVGDVVLNFQAGVAIDTTDAQGNFSVMLPYPPGAQIPVRAIRNGITGLNDRITIPDAAALTLFFDPRS